MKNGWNWDGKKCVKGACPQFQTRDSKGQCVCDPRQGVTWDGKGCVCDMKNGWNWDGKKCVKSGGGGGGGGNVSGTITLMSNEETAVLNKGTYPGQGGKRYNRQWNVPSNMSDSCLLEVDVFFPSNFWFGCQGKLFGFFLSRPGQRGVASGCAKPGKRTGASYRVMWGGTTYKNGKRVGRDGSGVYPYLYFDDSTNSKQIPKLKQVEDCGHSIMVEEFSRSIKRNAWNNIKIGLKLNTIGQRNGLIYFEVNGQKQTQDQVMWTSRSDFNIKYVIFGTFYGGCTGQNINQIPNTFVKYKNVKISKWSP
ncbi:hypothetical protein PBCVKS1B_546L [Paramecium bursaria Chlorella virus KS1B]|nr:hypothetical protein PBCVKS1B_546L [Paramecium bursaria Chlorella virus KS1B]